MPNPLKQDPRFSLSYGYWSEPWRDIPPCGDGAATCLHGSSYWLIVIDAIGHGPVAYSITQLILDHFTNVLAPRTSERSTPSRLLRALHNLLRTRHRDEQAAIGLFHFNLSAHTVEAAIVGNLEASFLTPSNSIRLQCQNGMVGGHMPTHVRVAHYPFVQNGVLAVCSDGVRYKDLTDTLPGYVYPVDSSRMLDAVARTLVTRFRRPYDDASCALVRIEALSNG